MRLARVAFLAACVAGCNAGRHAERSEAAESRPWRTPGDKIDSILPMAEYLHRFRTGLTEPAALSGGGSSRDDMARRFLTAVSARDSAALAGLAVTRAEFAWLVFPFHKYHNPPYDLDPAIFWMQLSAGSSKGLHRTLERYGGIRLQLLGLGCTRDTLQAASDSLRLWSGCTLRFRRDGAVEVLPLFGSIVERDGRFKLLSFSNDF